MKKNYSDAYVDIRDLGIYKDGLTVEEIKKYLKARTTVKDVNAMYKKFCKIAGVNTVVIIKTECCYKPVCLMYRHDIERFADKLIKGTETYWD